MLIAEEQSVTFVNLKVTAFDEILESKLIEQRIGQQLLTSLLSRAFFQSKLPWFTLMMYIVHVTQTKSLLIILIIIDSFLPANANCGVIGLLVIYLVL